MHTRPPPLYVVLYNSTYDTHSTQFVLILEELQVPYVIKSFKFDDVKKPPFININPNDTEKKLTYDTLSERHLLNQYLHFQMSVLHAEKITSAVDRYVNELVRDKCTFQDLAFQPWNDRVNISLGLPPCEDPLEPYPKVQAWHRRMEVRQRLMDDQELQVNGMPKGVTNIKEY
ncbi:hypothetical protein BO70DRAFT_388137 [Aspergillus heteromorphus CBS 117.55]|uniref:glutathione transferase n=1 Tax=Aspergillus heteromorphus CBS 117.55 TaxID=1448321 RepID=A0A317W2B5_9EURO|nr:uncharacterized protein BO70DRAFT_388137 [Aspergillus heteromorphus CBS 117.55]PWY78320.1 hypothetical protein BO70DRAFT_388137 [Aspergillus heteromorphus CBS 117.55]